MQRRTSPKSECSVVLIFESGLRYFGRNSPVAEQVKMM